MKYLLLACCLAVCSFVYAQSVTVVDQPTLQPIEHVSIFRSDTSLSMLTNLKGNADISSFTSGDTLIFQHPAYQPRRISFAQLIRENYKVRLTEKTYALDEIVISASKFAEKKSDVPQQIQVLAAKELAFISQPTTAEVLQNSGNVLIQKSQLGGGSPIIRGFEANKVLLVVDGVRLNNAIYRGGHLQNVITLDNSVLDKVEVVFGPGSVMYGSDALGGVVHFYTKDPVLAESTQPVNLKTNAFVRYATASSEQTGHADVNVGFRKVGLFSSFTVSDFGDLRQGNSRNNDIGELGKRSVYVQRINGLDSALVNNDPNVQKQSGYRQYDFLQKVLYTPSERVSHMLNFQYSGSSDVPRYDRLTQERNGKPRFGEWYYGPQKRLLASYKVDLQAGNTFYDHARLIAAYQRLEESRYDRAFGEDLRSSRIEQVDVFTLNADLSKVLGKHEFRYGAEGTFNDVQSEAFAENVATSSRAREPIGTRYPDGGSTMQTWALYATHTWEISPTWIVSDGLRYSNVRLDATFRNKTFFPFLGNNLTQQSGALNGNVGVVFQPGADWRFAALGSSGFRAPNVDDLGKVFESVPGNVVIPNPDIRPEYTYNAELSISKVIAGRVKLEATSYYTWFRDAIVAQPATLNGADSIVFEGELSRVTANRNTQNAYLYGFSANLAADFTDAISLTSALNYTYGRIRTDSTDYPLDHIPPVFGKTSVVWKGKQFRGEFFALYNGWKRLKNYNQAGEDNLSTATPQGMPAWYTLNIRAAYQVNKHLQLQAALENMLDRNYRVFASGISAPGRNLVITLRGNL